MSVRGLKLYGTEAPPSEQRVLSAGPVSVTLESGQLRWIKVGRTEAVRAIGFVVRNQFWGTPVPEIRDLKVVERGGGFRVTFSALCRTPDGEIAWRGDFTGKPDGTITCVGSATPEKDFPTCRTGFVILHPLAGFVGQRIEIEHTDGTVEKAPVPETLVNSQPFLLVRSMTYAPKPGMKVTLRMEGDSFETEDQRNWTDASLKTYCRPLSLPWPYTIEAGETVRQTVTLSFAGRLPKTGDDGDRPVALKLGRARGTMPQIGLSVLPEDAVRALDAAGTVKAAGVQHLNCRVDLRAPDWRTPLAAYRTLAKASGTGVVLEAIIPGDDAQAEVRDVAKAAKEAGVRPAAVVVTPAADLRFYAPSVPLPTDVPSWQEIAAAARRAFPRARIGGGMLANFTEMNRKRPPKGLFDFITHATSALVHAADDRSVMETLEALGHVIRSGQKIAGRTPYRIGPSHIGNSYNPYGASYAENPNGERVAMARIEPRHRGLFGAAWHLGYLSQVADGGLEAATMASPAGEFGIAYQKRDYRQPLFDDDPDAKVYPVFHVIRGLAAAAGAKRIPVESGDPGRVRAVAWRDGRTTHLWMANLREIPVEVRLPEQAAQEARVWMLDETTFEDAIRDPAFGDRASPHSGRRIALSPFAVARVALKS